MQKIILSITVSIFAPAVLAHHPLNGMPMETLAQGFLSGLGHPVLGFDHLFFVVLLGIVALFSRNRFLIPLAYILTMLAGCFMTAIWTGLPAKEIMIGLSLLILGIAVARGRNMNAITLILMSGGFGLFHGSAFGETLANQEAGFGAMILFGYLAGLAIIQYAISILAGWCYHWLNAAVEPQAVQVRLSGAVVAGAGLLLTLENLEALLI